MLLSKVLNAIKWNLFGKTTSTVLAFLLMTLIARWLGPSEYGAYLILTTIITMFQIIGFLGFETGLLKYVPEYNVKKELNEIRQLFLSFALIRLALSVITIVSIILLANFLTKTVFIRAQLQLHHLYLFLFVIFALGLNGLFRNLLDALYKQKILNLLDVIAIFIRLGLTAILLRYSRSISSVIIAFAIVEWSTLIVLVVIVRHMFNFTFNGLPANFKKVLFFSLTIWITNIAGQLLGKNSDIFLLGMFVNPRIVGSYGLAYTLANMVFMLFMFPIGNIALIAASEIYSKRDPQQLTEFSSAFLKYHALFIFPILVGGEILASNLIQVLYGGQYISSIIFFKIFLGMFAITMLFGGIVGSILPVIGAHRILLWGQTFGIINVLINLFLIPRYGAWGALAGTTIIGLISAAFFIIMLAKRMRLEFPIAFFLKALFSAAVMGISLLPLKSFISGPSTLLFCICAGLVVYILVLRMCKPFTERDTYLLENSNISGKRFIRHILVS